MSPTTAWRLAASRVVGKCMLTAASAAAKPPPPPNPPPFFKFGSGRFFKQDIRFPRTPPPGRLSLLAV